jgi:hypothetical protein
LPPPTGGAVMRFQSRARRHVGPPVPSSASGAFAGCTAPRTVGTLLVVALLLTACSTAPATEPAAEAPPDPPPAEAPSRVPDEPDPAAEAPTDEEQLGELWAAFYRAWVEQAPLEDPASAAFADLAVDPDQTTADLVAQRLDSRPVVTEFEQWPQVVIDGDTATITDCVIATQHERDEDGNAVTLSTSWEAQATSTAEGWRIETAGPRDLFCVPEELNEQLLGAYREYREALDAAWDPPDPDHPALQRTMTGEQLTFIRELLAEHERDGIVVREPAPTDNAVVWELGIGIATVSDCTEQVPEYGAFDLETGERLDELVPPVEPGRLDAQSVDLDRNADGTWQVVDQAASRDTDCDPGSTRYAVP